MTVPSRSLISVLLGLVAVSVLLYLYINPTTFSGYQQGKGEIVIRVPATVIQETVSSDKDSLQPAADSFHLNFSSTTSPATSPVPSPSPSPSTSSLPAANDSTDQSAQKIPDSWQHVKDTQDILDFVKKQCKNYDLATGIVTKPRLMIIPKNWKQYKILYASNPKTGSTSFKKWYLRLQGDTRDYAEITGVHSRKKYGVFNDAQSYYDLISAKPLSFKELISKFYKVGFVRNPLTRLISGFRDKILRRTKTGMKEPMTVINPNLTADSSESEKFAAFVEAVMTGKITNFHFTPQWNKQKICDFPYDLLAQTETTTQQIRILQDVTNTTMFEFPGSRSDNGYDSVATVSLARQFYENVRPEIMDMVYEYYKWDFVLTGYATLNNPNFPYLDFDQNFEKVFRTLSQEREPTDNPPATDTSYNVI